MGTFLQGLEHFKRFVVSKPRVLPRIAMGYFNGVVLRRKVLRTIDWAVSYACNARCGMCSARGLFDKNRREMTLEQRRQVWLQAQELGVIHTQLTGGEPLLKGTDWVTRAIRDLEPDRFLVSMVSNASLLTEEKLLKFKEAGLDTIQMSLDYFDSERHDQNRLLKGNRDHIVRMVKYARSIGLNSCIAALVCHDNFDDIYKMLDFAKKNGAFVSLSPIACPENWSDKDTYELINHEDDMKKYRELLKDPNVRSDTSFNFDGQVGCPSGERLYISAYGDVFSCPLVQVSFGNVLQEPLKVIWERLCSSEMFGSKRHNDLCRQAFEPGFREKYIWPFAEFKKPVDYDTVIGKKKV
ncbi:MAG: radical SAM/SPASM domain-containing protein [Candidatus Micrarchaeia archaeon]